MLRGFIVSAMRQIFFRHKETKQQIVDFIYVKMPEETYNELLAIMIVVLQDLTKGEIWFERRFVLHGEISWRYSKG